MEMYWEQRHRVRALCPGFGVFLHRSCVQLLCDGRQTLCMTRRDSRVSISHFFAVGRCEVTVSFSGTSSCFMARCTWKRDEEAVWVHTVGSRVRECGCSRMLWKVGLHVGLWRQVGTGMSGTSTAHSGRDPFLPRVAAHIHMGGMAQPSDHKWSGAGRCCLVCGGPSHLDEAMMC